MHFTALDARGAGCNNCKLGCELCIRRQRGSVTVRSGVGVRNKGRRRAAAWLRALVVRYGLGVAWCGKAVRPKCCRGRAGSTRAVWLPSSGPACWISVVFCSPGGGLQLLCLVVTMALKG